MRLLLSVLISALSLAGLIATAGALSTAVSANVHRFKTEVSATEHCPGDTVVWGSSRGIYFRKDSRYYGKSKGAAYVCASEAYAAGWREAKDG
jgi:hypothetical protein